MNNLTKISNGVNKTLITIIISISLMAGLIWLAKPRPSDQNNLANLTAGVQGILTAEENKFDFGSISMTAGEVRHRFKIKNAGTDAVTIEKMYTSCMCTQAVLILKEKQWGPYGMPGHGFIPKINQTLAAGAEAIVETVFDPAAHGPAGVGRVERTVVIENNAGQPLELSFSATVTP